MSKDPNTMVAPAAGVYRFEASVLSAEEVASIVEARSQLQKMVPENSTPVEEMARLIERRDALTEALSRVQVRLVQMRLLMTPDEISKAEGA